MQAFLRATAETPAIGGSSYTFRVNCKTMVETKRFIANIRVSISRLRNQALSNDLGMAKFVVSEVAIDPITKINHDAENSVVTLGHIIQLERRKKQRRALPQSAHMDFIYLLELPTTDHEDVRNTRLAKIVEILQETNSYSFLASDWMEVLAAAWLIDKNFVIYRGYDEETNKHEIGRY